MDKVLRTVILIAGLAMVLLSGGPAYGTTLEKMTLDQMTQQSTEIVRGRVASSSVEQLGSIIYTVSQIQVAQRWKGPAAATVTVSVLGGKLGNLNQTFAGAPVLQPGTEYVLFLWTGKSGRTQVIGFSQGVFDLKLDAKGQPQVARAATTEAMLDSSGRPATDTPVRMSLSALDQAIHKALAAGTAK